MAEHALPSAGVPTPSGTHHPEARRERLWAWSMSMSASSDVYRPATIAEIPSILEMARARGQSVGLRGAGQSYGDAALNAGQVTLDLSRLRAIRAWDPRSGNVTVEPGVTIGDLWRSTLADGWWPPVVPGTMYTSLGGCAAMNVHGKNNWKVGAIGDHILEFDLLLPNGEVRRCSRTANADLFHAAIGGFGMLGCFLSITLRMKRVYSGLLDVEAVTAANLEEMIAIFETRLAHADYLVGWVDAAARGPALGRGVIHQANNLAEGADPDPQPTLRADAQELPSTILGVPKSIVWRFMRPLMNAPGVRAVNTVKYRTTRLRGRHRFRQTHAAFHFLFDYIPGWKRACGPGGFIQYQSFIPAADAGAVFREQLAMAHRAGLIPYIGVFKRHRADDFLMSPNVDGYSLALELKVTRSNREAVWALARRFDALVVGARGRFYFAKDSTLSAASLAEFMREERVQRFFALKREHDPEGLLQTDLYRRLFADGAR